MTDGSLYMLRLRPSSQIQFKIPQRHSHPFFSNQVIFTPHSSSSSSSLLLNTPLISLSLSLSLLFTSSSLDSQRAIFQLGFPAQFPDFHFPSISTVARVNLKCASPVDPWRDSVDFEFRCLNKNNKKRFVSEHFYFTCFIYLILR